MQLQCVGEAVVDVGEVRERRWPPWRGGMVGRVVRFGEPVQLFEHAGGAGVPVRFRTGVSSLSTRLRVGGVLGSAPTSERPRRRQGLMGMNAGLGKLRRVLADLVRSGLVRVGRAKAGALAGLRRRMPSVGYDALLLVVGLVDAGSFAVIRRAARVGVGG